MRRYLLFRLYGPLASWGDIAVGGMRPTYSHPTKSAILGMLAAAMGIRRSEEEAHSRLAEACSVAVRIDRDGAFLRDFHTVQVPITGKKTECYTRRDEIRLAQKQNANAIISRRDYRMDAMYTVCVWRNEGVHDEAGCPTLMDLRVALERPVFCLYLGRKSCPPALPLQAQVLSAATLKEAFEKAEFNDSLLGRDFVDTEQCSVFWDSTDQSGFEDQHIHTTIRRDVPLSRKRWQFAERVEHYAGVSESEEG